MREDGWVEREGAFSGLGLGTITATILLFCPVSLCLFLVNRWVGPLLARSDADFGRSATPSCRYRRKMKRASVHASWRLPIALSPFDRSMSGTGGGRTCPRRNTSEPLMQSLALATLQHTKAKTGAFHCYLDRTSSEAKVLHRSTDQGITKPSSHPTTAQLKAIPCASKTGTSSSSPKAATCPCANSAPPATPTRTRIPCTRAPRPRPLPPPPIPLTTILPRRLRRRRQWRLPRC